MSLEANIEHLKSANGIEAVLVRSQSSDGNFRGEERWNPILGQALDLFAICAQPSMRLVVGSHTIVVQKENAETAAVALATGHPIAKSLRRMIRRMSRKVRPPIEHARQASPFSVRTGLSSTTHFSRHF